MDDPLPARSWELSAPESLALLWGPETGDTWALSLAILELAVRQSLTLRAVTSRKLLIFPRTTLVLAGRIEPAALLDDAVGAVWEAHPNPRSFAGGISGIPVDRVTRTLLGSAAGRAKSDARAGGVYVQDYVLPGLVRHGLYLPGYPYLPLTITEEGKSRLADLRRFLEFGRQWASSSLNVDPAQALDFVDRARSSLLLVRGLPYALRWMVSRHGPPATWNPSPRITRRAGPAGSDTGATRPPISIHALLGKFGPNPGDDLDMALYAITTEVEREWVRSFRQDSGVAGAGE